MELMLYMVCLPAVLGGVAAYMPDRWIQGKQYTKGSIKKACMYGMAVCMSGAFVTGLTKYALESVLLYEMRSLGYLICISIIMMPCLQIFEILCITHLHRVGETHAERDYLKTVFSTMGYMRWAIFMLLGPIVVIKGWIGYIIFSFIFIISLVHSEKKEYNELQLKNRVRLLQGVVAIVAVSELLCILYLYAHAV